MGEGRDRERIRLAQGPAPDGSAAAPGDRRAAGLADAATRPPLAIASCGNAALAAAVVAAAGRRPLRVFVPVDADPAIVRRLEELGAGVEVCPRAGREEGDPTYLRLREAVAGGALPFTCQGNLNGLAIEGGHDAGYEIADATRRRAPRRRRGPGRRRRAGQRGDPGPSRGAHARRPGDDAAGPHGPDAGGASAGARLPRGRGAGRRDGDLEAAMRDAAPTGPTTCGRGRRSRRASPRGSSTTRRTIGVPSCTACSPPADGRWWWTRTCSRRRTTWRSRPRTSRWTPPGSSGLAGLMALRREGIIGDDDRVAVLFTGVRR